MSRRFALPFGVALVLVQTWNVTAQPPQPPVPSGQQNSAGQLPRSQVPDFGRPTKETDPQPVFDFARYFVGKWTFEWDVPSSPLGEGGVISGTEVFTATSRDGRYFESDVQADGPDGPIKSHAVIIYLKDGKVVSRSETDSRGFTLIRSGLVGGDLGGYFNIYYESAPFTVNGKSVRLRTTTHLFSPVQFNVRAQISVDGGPFTNYGNPWWKKSGPPQP